MWKKCKVAMLATNNITNIWLRNKKFGTDQYLFETRLGIKPCLNNEQYQHLYILSDDEIKEGNWCVHLGISNGTICIAKTSNDGHIVYHEKGVNPIKEYGTIYGGLTPLPHEIKKIIATTDSSLKLYESESLAKASGFSLNTNDILLPSIPQSFIDKYISEFNKGNKIEEVMVEYKDNYARNEYGDVIASNHYLKINPDNTINIQSIKDSWTREEVKTLFDRFIEFISHHDSDEWDNWIKNNL